MSDCPPTIYGPCGTYADIEDVTACGPCRGMDLSGTAEDNPLVAEVEQALRWATRRVFEATGGAWWGCCEIEVAPCRPTECGGPIGTGPAWPPPSPTSGPWDHLPAVPWATFGPSGEPVFVNVWSCGCASADPCSCGAIGDRVLLPFGPIRDVVAITIDGEDLPEAGHWTLLRHEGVIARTDGGSWPRCQDRSQPLGEPGTWSIRYRHGFDPPPELRPLVAAYACELAKACQGGECALPAGFRVVQRDGVEFAVAEPSEYREQGLTGFGPLDDWIMLMRGGHVGYGSAPRAYRPALPMELM